MYKCSECGTEYEIKPEYCDCGNDVFEEIVQAKPLKQEPKQEQKIVIKQPAPKVEVKQPKVDYSKSLQCPKPTYDYSGLKKFFDPVSTIVFLCLVVAAMYVTWIGYDPEFYAKKAESAKAQKEEKVVNVPAIDAFWDNTPMAKPAVLPKPEPVQSEQKIVQLVEQVFKPQPKPQTSTQVPKVQPKPQTTTKQTTTPKTTTQTSKTTTKPATTQTGKSTAQTTKTQTQTPKTTTQTTKNSTSTQTSSSQNKSGIDLNNIINNNKKYTNNTRQQTSSQTSTKTQTSSSASTAKPSASTASTTTTAPAIRPSSGTSTSTTTATSNKTTTPVQTVDPAVAKQELANYKVGLRNTIGKKIDFTRVVGDGECSLSFKIDSSGRLVNRAFTKQSSNITLNDAAYAAMNATTRYNVPPSAYKGETLNLSIRFYNGNFNISLN